jgi:hypothetical protein
MSCRSACSASASVAALGVLYTAGFGAELPTPAQCQPGCRDSGRTNTRPRDCGSRSSRGQRLRVVSSIHQSDLRRYDRHSTAVRPLDHDQAAADPQERPRQLPVRVRQTGNRCTSDLTAKPRRVLVARVWLSPRHLHRGHVPRRRSPLSAHTGRRLTRWRPGARLARSPNTRLPAVPLIVDGRHADHRHGAHHEETPTAASPCQAALLR